MAMQRFHHVVGRCRGAAKTRAFYKAHPRLERSGVGDGWVALRKAKQPLCPMVWAHEIEV